MDDARRDQIARQVAELKGTVESAEQRRDRLAAYVAHIVEDTQLTYTTAAGARHLEFLKRTYLDGAPTLDDLVDKMSNEEAMNTAREARGAARVVRAIIAAMEGKVAYHV